MKKQIITTALVLSMTFVSSVFAFAAESAPVPTEKTKISAIKVKNEKI